MSLRSLISDAFGGRQRPDVALSPLDPSAGPIYAVGDVHGCRTLLQGLLARISTDAAAFAGTPHVVLLGDVVDRGPETAVLLDDLQRPLPWGRLTAIRGNHEEMMLAFITDPHRNADWLAQGGFETLRSYGLPLDPRDLPKLPKRRVTQMLAAHLPEEHLRWLEALPWGHTFNLDGQDWVLAHAGYDPARTPTSQRAQDLVWGARMPHRGDNIRLVHGHLIQKTVDIDAPAVGIDTGAYATGCLSALRLAQNSAPTILTFSVAS